MNLRKIPRSAVSAGGVILVIAFAAGVARSESSDGRTKHRATSTVSATSAAWVHTLDVDGTNLQTSTVGKSTRVVGLIKTMYTVKVTVQDLNADGLEACIQIEAALPNFGQNQMRPETFCDERGAEDGATTGWYTNTLANTYTITQYVKDIRTGKVVHSAGQVTVTV
jgi:hypothetical protein